MQCSEISGLMMKYLDNDISETELKALEKHNLDCKSCSMEFQGLKNAVNLVEALPDIPPPYSLKIKVMERIKREKYKQSSINLLVGTVGLFSFAYYMILFVMIPYINNMEIIETIYGYGAYGLKVFAKYFTDIFVYLLMFIGNLIKLRNILIKDYMNVMLVFSSIAMILNLSLIKILNPQQK